MSKIDEIMNNIKEAQGGNSSTNQATPGGNLAMGANNVMQQITPIDMPYLYHDNGNLMFLPMRPFGAKGEADYGWPAGYPTSPAPDYIADAYHTRANLFNGPMFMGEEARNPQYSKLANRGARVGRDVGSVFNIPSQPGYRG